MKGWKALWISLAAAFLGLFAAGCMEGSDTVLAGEEEELGDALVAAWCFDEESGDAAVDSSVSSWDGEEVFFKGKIDDIRVYDRALTEEEVYEMYYAG